MQCIPATDCSSRAIEARRADVHVIEVLTLGMLIFLLANRYRKRVSMYARILATIPC